MSNDVANVTGGRRERANIASPASAGHWEAAVALLARLPRCRTTTSDSPDGNPRLSKPSPRAYAPGWGCIIPVPRGGTTDGQIRGARLPPTVPAVIAAATGPSGGATVPTAGGASSLTRVRFTPCTSLVCAPSQLRFNAAASKDAAYASPPSLVSEFLGPARHPSLGFASRETRSPARRP